ncbi:MAG TPA: four helix bundle protein [Bacteroidia bacterium]|jgi:four helix bundle protein|nr:four helix bundle protein [Bacteroidia bacterium]
MKDQKENAILKLSFQFALKIVEYSEVLDDNRKWVLSKQLLKSGTSIGANIREAQGAESRNDFIHKLKISYKEAEETEYWLDLCRDSKNYPDPGQLSEEIVVLKKILSRIISSLKSNSR